MRPNGLVFSGRLEQGWRDRDSSVLLPASKIAASQPLHCNAMLGGNRIVAVWHSDAENSALWHGMTVVYGTHRCARKHRRAFKMLDGVRADTERAFRVGALA